MVIEELSFLNIRKTKEAHYKFFPNTNIIIGKNGEGKTTALEAIYLLSTTKSFRKKQHQALKTNGEKKLTAQGIFIENKTKTKTTITIENKKKTIKNNNQIVKKTSDHIQKIQTVCISPEEDNVIESLRSEKAKYFDKIIFKTNTKHIQNIINYKKLLRYRNILLEERKNSSPWDIKIAETGIAIWKSRDIFFNSFLKLFYDTQKNIHKTKTYTIQYLSKKITTTTNYVEKLKKEENQEKTQTGPHKDSIIFKINNKELQPHGSQGEKKFFKHLLKLTEIKFLQKQTEQKPILLIDDFFAKLDEENIMKIFTYFHCKFQTIITTTNKEEKHILKQLHKEKNNNNEINIIKCQ